MFWFYYSEKYPSHALPQLSQVECPHEIVGKGDNTILRKFSVEIANFCSIETISTNT